MVDFTEAERLQIARALADGMGDDTVKAEGVLPGNAKDIFCKNWDLVKTVLGYLKPLLPGPIGWVVGAIITAGDILHKKIC